MKRALCLQGTERDAGNQKMLPGREAVGRGATDWSQAFLGIGKSRRKTVGFGKYDKKEREWEDEIYIKELSILEGGIGCALWDAAIILTRWIYHHRELFSGRITVELGAGVGLPGVVASRFAAQCYLTDHIDKLVELLEYNLWLNGNYDEDDESLPQDQKDMKKNVQRAGKALKLDWLVKNEDYPKVIPEKGVKVLFGSELTYTGHGEIIDALLRCIGHYLDPEEGFFLEILSDDRDGVPLFLERMESLGYLHCIWSLPEKYLGNYGTGQRPETYKLYAFWRPENRTIRDNLMKIIENEPCSYVDVSDPVE